MSLWLHEILFFYLLQAIMTWKVLSMVAVASVAALLHYETESDILYVEKEVVVPVTRAKAFLFIADMSNYRRVCCPVFDGLTAVLVS